MAAQRDLAIIYFIYSTGLRISEVLQFKFSDTPFNDQIKVIGKGKKERYVPILPIIKDKISKYIEALIVDKYRNLNNDLCFENKFQKKIRTNSERYSAKHEKN